MLEDEVFKANCTFAPSIGANSRLFLNPDIRERTASPPRPHKVSKARALEFYHRQLKQKQDTEQKISDRRQALAEKEEEELTFEPVMVAQQIEGVERVVESFNKARGARPAQTKVLFGEGVYMNGSKSLSRTRRAHDT